MLEALGGAPSEVRVVAEHALEQLHEALITDVGVQVAQCFDLTIGGLGRRVRLVERRVVLEHLLLGDEAQVLLVLMTELVQDTLELVTLADNVHVCVRFLHLFTRRQRKARVALEEEAAVFGLATMYLLPLTNSGSLVSVHTEEHFREDATKAPDVNGLIIVFLNEDNFGRSVPS